MPNIQLGRSLMLMEGLDGKSYMAPSIAIISYYSNARVVDTGAEMFTMAINSMRFATIFLTTINLKQNSFRLKITFAILV